MWTLAAVGSPSRLLFTTGSGGLRTLSLRSPQHTFSLRVHQYSGGVCIGCRGCVGLGAQFSGTLLAVSSRAPKHDMDRRYFDVFSRPGWCCIQTPRPDLYREITEGTGKYRLSLGLLRDQRLLKQRYTLRQGMKASASRIVDTLFHARFTYCLSVDTKFQMRRRDEKKKARRKHSAPS